MKKDKNNEIVENYEKIQNFAQVEIERTHRTFRLFVYVLTLIFTVGIAIAAILIGKSVTDIQDKYERNYQTSVQEMTIEMRRDVNTELDITKQKINDEIKQEFEKENIQNMVIQQTKDRIDKIADPIIESQITRKIDPIKKDLKNLQTEIDRITFDYYLLAIENDSRPAFIKLYELSNNKKSENKNEIKKALSRRIQDIENFLARKTGDLWELNYTGIRTENDFYLQYKDSITSDKKIYYLEALWKDKKFFNQKQKNSIFIKLFPNEKSLTCSYYIAKSLINEFEWDIKPSDFDKVYKKIKTRHDY